MCVYFDLPDCGLKIYVPPYRPYGRAWRNSIAIFFGCCDELDLLRAIERLDSEN